MPLNRRKGVAEGGSRLNCIVPNRYKRLAAASDGLRNRPPALVLDITLLAPA